MSFNPSLPLPSGLAGFPVQSQTISASKYNDYIDVLLKAMQASSGFEREKLKAQINEASAARNNALKIAQLSAQTSRYGVDQQTKVAMAQLEQNQKQFDAKFGLSVAELTGTYNGQPTQAAKEFAQRYGLDLAQITGSINGEPTQAAKEFAQKYGLSVGEMTGEFGGKPTLDAQTRLGQLQIQKDQLALQYGQAYADNWFKEQQIRLADEERDLDRARLGLEYANTYSKLADDPTNPWALSDWEAGLNQTSAGQGMPIFLQRLQQNVVKPTWEARGGGTGPGTLGMGGLLGQQGVDMQGGTDPRALAAGSVLEANPPSPLPGRTERDQAALDTIANIYMKGVGPEGIRPRTWDALDDTEQQTYLSGLRRRYGGAAPSRWLNTIDSARLRQGVAGAA